MAKAKSDETAADLRARAEELEKQEAEDAAAEALKNETPAAKKARLAAEKAAGELRTLVEDPTDDQKATTVGVDHGGSGVYSYVELPKPYDLHFRQPRLTLRGKNVEHVGEDAFGRWLYRQM